MSYLIILAVIALALAPLSHFVPSKRQRKTARLREYAALQGLFVEFRNPPEIPVPHDNHGQTIYYGKRVRPTAQSRLTKMVWFRRDSDWAVLPRGEIIPAQLRLLPEDIIAVSADQESCGIYWQETGEEAQIEQISQVLGDLAKVLHQ